jgi:hypothetical protein
MHAFLNYMEKIKRPIGLRTSDYRYLLVLYSSHIITPIVEFSKHYYNKDCNI